MNVTARASSEDNLNDPSKARTLNQTLQRTTRKAGPPLSWVVPQIVLTANAGLPGVFWLRAQAVNWLCLLPAHQGEYPWLSASIH